MMRTSPRGIADIALSEGLRTRAYRDVGGVWTIGYGHTSAAGAPKVLAGMVITTAEAKDILARDLAKFEARVNKAFPKGMPQWAFDGAVSFDLNTGAIDSASWVTEYKLGHMSNAETRLKLWNKVNKKVVEGLVKRRQAEADLIFRGKYRNKPVGAAPAPAPVPPPPDIPSPIPHPLEPEIPEEAETIQPTEYVIGFGVMAVIAIAGFIAFKLFGQ